METTCFPGLPCHTCAETLYEQAGDPLWNSPRGLGPQGISSSPPHLLCRVADYCCVALLFLPTLSSELQASSCLSLYSFFSLPTIYLQSSFSPQKVQCLDQRSVAFPSKASPDAPSQHCPGKMRQLKGKPKKETSKDKKERKQAMQEARQQITTVVLPTLAVVVLLIVVFVYVATRPTITE